ncbi:UDP-N-acetylglucosamine1-carboxyvinyltransferase [Striga asiatica]|uniref:UDP-N-acetylglucosamine1-carboxyvinyltransferase n=1 Tax=Striga asiatica TaxID=4170 RepID=A0A5A7QN59_STRAF|nr:UDP-N-acetylglucosamine1-carboxyvinyltransferase [Striga asiatica]
MAIQAYLSMKPGESVIYILLNNVSCPLQFIFFIDSPEYFKNPSPMEPGVAVFYVEQQNFTRKLKLQISKIGAELLGEGRSNEVSGVPKIFTRPVILVSINILHVLKLLVLFIKIKHITNIISVGPCIQIIHITK